MNVALEGDCAGDVVGVEDIIGAAFNVVVRLLQWRKPTI